MDEAKSSQNELVFKQIENGSIFTNAFKELTEDNKISFYPTNKKIAIIYAPNGTGKTSLLKVLSGADKTHLNFSYIGQDNLKVGEVFHIIQDQTCRNIIQGETGDFILGDNIRLEIELSDAIADARQEIINQTITLLKRDFGISAAKNPIMALISNKNLKDFVSDCANQKSKGKLYPPNRLIECMSQFQESAKCEYDQAKFDFLKSDYNDDVSIIKILDVLVKTKIESSPEVAEIEENTDAIAILERYNKDTCIVCDNDHINRDMLLQAKTSHRQATLDALDPKAKEALEKVSSIPEGRDPFCIKETLLNALESGITGDLVKLHKEIERYKSLYVKVLETQLRQVFNKTSIAVDYEKYAQIISERPNIEDDDFRYIETVISSSMNHTLQVDRDENNQLHIYLSDENSAKHEVTNTDRNELPLSTGEQNFLSLTFEFLKAKNSKCPVVVIDDPISSFDSIYKNKVAYAIIKTLSNKHNIILSHTTDLIRLLDSQSSYCFNLYLLNNTDGERNGFISVTPREQGMLISLEKLLTSVRKEITRDVIHFKQFLIAMIPFMRGYANITGNDVLYKDLCNVMHGYKTEKVDIARAYALLFGSQQENNASFPVSYEVSVKDILQSSADNINLLDPTKYPLLNKTLLHSFEYLYLRLKVESCLYPMIKCKKGKTLQLGQIIALALSNDKDKIHVVNRVKLMSKKTLINEFNHFEGNMSIFQPAMDITDAVLKKERADIHEILEIIKNHSRG